MLPRVFDMFAQADRTYQPRAGRARHRPHARAQPRSSCTAARVEAQQRRARPRQRVHRAPAARRRQRASVASRRARRARGRARRAARPRRRRQRRRRGEPRRCCSRCLGADVRIASDGPTALDELEAFRPAVVLLDIGMPGMDGYEVARRARQRADGSDADADRADRLGPGGGPPALARGRLRPPPREARRSRRARSIAHGSRAHASEPQARAVERRRGVRASCQPIPTAS